MKKIRVNVKHKVDNSTIRQEKIDNRDVFVVPSATMPDDIVMNKICYPAKEIEKSYRTLEKTPAPLGHPVDGEGNFISSLDPVALNGHYFGCYNSSVIRKDGRVLLDKVIDVERAKESVLGNRVLEAIENGKPIHTSTGLVAELKEAEESDGDFDYIACNILFDHDAILLDEDGAATPEQGVGMMLGNKKIDVVNSDLSNSMTAPSTREAVDSSFDKFKSFFFRKETLQNQENAMGDDKANEMPEKSMADMMKALRSMMDDDNVNMDEMKAAMDKMMSIDQPNGGGGKDMEGKTPDAMQDMIKSMMKEMMTNIMPSMIESMMKDYQANAEKEKLVEDVVNADLLDRKVAEDSSKEVLEAVLEKANPNWAAPITGNFKPSNKPVYELPEA